MLCMLFLANSCQIELVVPIIETSRTNKIPRTSRQEFLDMANIPSLATVYF